MKKLLLASLLLSTIALQAVRFPNPKKFGGEIVSKEEYDAYQGNKSSYQKDGKILRITFGNNWQGSCDYDKEFNRLNDTHYFRNFCYCALAAGTAYAAFKYFQK